MNPLDIRFSKAEITGVFANGESIWSVGGKLMCDPGSAFPSKEGLLCVTADRLRMHFLSFADVLST